MGNENDTAKFPTSPPRINISRAASTAPNEINMSRSPLSNSVVHTTWARRSVPHVIVLTAPTHVSRGVVNRITSPFKDMQSMSPPIRPTAKTLTGIHINPAPTLIQSPTPLRIPRGSIRSGDTQAPPLRNNKEVISISPPPQPVLLGYDIHQDGQVEWMVDADLVESTDVIAQNLQGVLGEPDQPEWDTHAFIDQPASFEQAAILEVPEWAPDVVEEPNSLDQTFVLEDNAVVQQFESVEQPTVTEDATFSEEPLPEALIQPKWDAYTEIVEQPESIAETAAPVDENVFQESNSVEQTSIESPGLLDQLDQDTEQSSFSGNTWWPDQTTLEEQSAPERTDYPEFRSQPGDLIQPSELIQPIQPHPSTPSANPLQAQWASDTAFSQAVGEDSGELMGADDEVAAGQVQSTNNRKFHYLIGKRSGRNIVDKNGQLIVAKNAIITQDVLDQARQAGKFIELIIYMRI